METKTVTVCPRFHADGEDEWYCQLEAGHRGDCQHETDEWIMRFGLFGTYWGYKGRH